MVSDNTMQALNAAVEDPQAIPQGEDSASMGRSRLAQRERGTGGIG